MGDRAVLPGDVGADLAWARAARADRRATERRAAALAAAVPADAGGEIAWLLRAVRCLDLTTLAGDDTPARVRRLAARARRPIPADLLAACGWPGAAPRVASVCVYPSLVPAAREALAGSGVAVCAVSGGFPSGLATIEARLADVATTVALRADEVDVVIRRGLVLEGALDTLYDEVRALRAACGSTTMKVILGTGDLATLGQVARASRVCLLAGADFLKTSTGKEATNASLPAGLVMARAIRAYRQRTGRAVGLKPAGGIGTVGQVLAWQALVRGALGEGWLGPDRFRIGASGALDEVVRRLRQIVEAGP